MNTKTNHTFWTDSKRSRYFLIPNNQKLTRGSFVIHTLTGAQKKVTQRAIAAFEISQNEAKTYLETEINQEIQQAKATFSHLFSSTQVAEEPLSIPNIISSLLGITPQELENNPEAAQTAFVNLYTDIKELLSESTEQNPAQVEATRSRVRALRETLQAQVIKFPENLSQELSEAKIEEYFPEILAQLQNLTKQIGQANTDTEKIDQTIETLTKDFFVKEEKAIQDKRKQQYKQSAKDAIAKSFQSRGLRSFAGGDFKS
jgi:hypothetical protein